MQRTTASSESTAIEAVAALDGEGEDQRVPRLPERAAVRGHVPVRGVEVEEHGVLASFLKRRVSVARAAERVVAPVRRGHVDVPPVVAAVWIRGVEPFGQEPVYGLREQRACQDECETQ